MATKEPTTVEREVSGKFTNPRDLQWPHDNFGFTSMTRKEGARAIGRIKGDPQKLDVFLQTLRVLAEHAKAKIEDQQKHAARTAAATRNREAAEYARSVAEQEAEVSRLEKLLRSAKEAVAAKKAMPKGTEPKVEKKEAE